MSEKAVFVRASNMDYTIFLLSRLSKRLAYNFGLLHLPDTQADKSGAWSSTTITAARESPPLDLHDCV